MATTRKTPQTTVIDTAGWLSREQAVDSLGVSYDTIESWQRRGLLKPQLAARGTLRKVFVYDPQVLARMPRKTRARAQSPSEAAGELNAQVFEMLDAGKTVREIVIKTRETQAKIESLREGWLDAGGCDLVIGGIAKSELEKVIGPFQTVNEMVVRILAREAKAASNGNVERASAPQTQPDATSVVIEPPFDARVMNATDADLERAILAALDSAEALPALGCPNQDGTRT